jgi:hypothetical protein
MSELETYQKLNLLNSYLADLKCKGRPPKWYRNMANYFHDNNIILLFEGDSVFDNSEIIKIYLNNTDAGMVNEIYYNTGFSAFGQFVG